MPRKTDSQASDIHENGKKSSDMVSIIYLVARLNQESQVDQEAHEGLVVLDHLEGPLVLAHQEILVFLPFLKMILTGFKP